MALFLLVLPSAVGGTKWDAVTQLIGAGLQQAEAMLAWKLARVFPVLAKLKHTTGVTWTRECSPP
jgi:hypothetical protein